MYINIDNYNITENNLVYFLEIDRNNQISYDITILNYVTPQKLKDECPRYCSNNLKNDCKNTCDCQQGYLGKDCREPAI